MARKIFFSFHYERDAWRAGQVRNCNVVPKEDQVGVIDAADWESIKKQGDAAIKRWIKEQLDGTSCTAVLIGAETAEREWVLHEITESWNGGKGIVGIWIHNVKDSDKKTDAKGANPLEKFKLSDGTLLSSICKTYDWVTDNGRENVAKWVEEAIQIRAKFAADSKIAKKSDDGLTIAAVAAGAVALGALANALSRQRSQSSSTPPPPSSSPSTAFTPRAPWGTAHDRE